jgi:hypothetical protein
MQGKTLILGVLAAATFHVPLASGQAPTWRVVAGQDGRIATANLPAGTNRGITDSLLGDAGADQVGFRVTTPTTSAGYWAAKQGVLTRYTQLGVTGPLGPGRSGSESSHVFLSVTTGGSGAAVDGQRAFLARASEPGSTVNASYGLWRWDLARNIEVARTLTNGTLGPGLGPDWTFPNAADFTSARAISGGRLLLDADVKSQTNLDRRLVALHVPGQGNRPCLMSASTDPLLSPGLTPGDTFSTGWSFNTLSVSPAGRAYGRFSASGSRAGIWEICNGAPRAIVANDDTGDLGPDIGLDAAAFTTGIEPPFPGYRDNFFFFSAFRRTPGASSDYGLFWHDGASNRAMAFNDDAGVYGPNWQNWTWRTFDQDSLSVGGDYTAFYATVATGDGGNVGGYWRVRAGQRPELLALVGIPGQFGPEPKRQWRSFGASAVLPTGDLLLEARTDPGNEYALWLLEPGRVPRRVLSIGQIVSLPTASGPADGAVTTFNLTDGGADHSRGTDSWVGMDGTVLVTASIANYGEVLLVSRPTDRIFINAFD